MHLPDGLLNNQASVGLIVVSATMVSYALKQMKNFLFEKTKVLVPQLMTNVGAMVGKQSFVNKLKLKTGAKKKIQQMILVFALLFTFQALDFIAIGEFSGHLIGAVLAALVLGPWMGMLVMSAVLTTQALMLGDGGVLALGANIINMAVIGCLGGYYLYFYLKKIIKNKYLAIGVATWLSLVAMAIVYSFEIAMFSSARLGTVLVSMLAIHALVGIIEAVVTIFAFKFLPSTIFKQDDLSNIIK